jgi:hypothetical protein
MSAGISRLAGCPGRSPQNEVLMDRRGNRGCLVTFFGADLVELFGSYVVTLISGRFRNVL